MKKQLPTLMTIISLLAYPVVQASSMSEESAHDEMEQALSLTPDLENGREVFEVCTACHLPEGWGKQDGTFPQISGQHQQVLIKQLADIRAKNRDAPTMYPFALPESLGGAQAITDVTAYIAKLPMNPDNGVGSGDNLAEGEKLYQENCSKCHGEQGEGVAEKFYPRIQGQHYEYLVRQLQDIRDHKRKNANPEMMEQVKSFTNEQLIVVADHVSRMKPPASDLGEPGWQNPDFQ